MERIHRRLSRLIAPAAAPYWQVAPLAGVLAVFFLLPLAITVVVSFWRYTEYSMIPALVGDNYASVFAGCLVPSRLVGVITAEQRERDGEVERNDRLVAVSANE